MKKLIFNLLVIIISLILIIQAEQISFLQLESGNETLGGANIAKLESSLASLRNPSGLSYLGNNEIYLFYSKPFAQAFDSTEGVEGVNYFFASSGLQAESFNYGMNLMYLNNSGMDRYDAEGNYKGQFSSREGALSFSLARKLKENISVGLQNRLIFQIIDNYSGVGYDAGVSATWYMTPRLSAALNTDNIPVSKIKMRDSAGYSESVNSTFGLAYLPAKFLLTAASVSYIYNYGFEYNVGTEFIIRNTVFLRMSYDNNNIMQNITPENKGQLSDNFSVSPYYYRELTGGFGIKLEQWKFDYSLRLHKELGMTHNVGAAYYLK